ncbi:putative ABC transport system substrate-binding protein [Rhizobiales bacterium GAS188]|nr:putative ABC transport system substrate-binding protein [Rhizobiales bacterium GAS188]
MRTHRLTAFIALTLASLALTAGAQTAKVYRVGFLGAADYAPGSASRNLADGIIRRLGELGYPLGTNLKTEQRGAEWHYERLPVLVAELLASKVDVIVANSYPAAAAAKRGTSTVPIVIIAAGDPVKASLVASLARPGGNITGISDVAAQLAPKRLEFLKETVPTLKRVAMLWNASDLGMTLRYEASAEAAKELGITVQSLGVREPNDFEAAFTAMTSDPPDGILMVSDALTRLNRKLVYDFAAAHRLPAIYEDTFYARDGGLMSYGPDAAESAERAASLVDRILKGTNPADLPLEQPTRIRLAINLKTAKALGLTIPISLLARADEVIE